MKIHSRKKKGDFFNASENYSWENTELFFAAKNAQKKSVPITIETVHIFIDAALTFLPPPSVDYQKCHSPTVQVQRP